MLTCACQSYLLQYPLTVSPSQVPIYAHAKQLVDPCSGRRTALEVNYMKFLAYNGSYKLFGWIPAGDLGAHDADWEHVTLRLTPDGRRVLGVYYSAHRFVPALRPGGTHCSNERLRQEV